MSAFESKSVIVTGGSSGIGRVTALRFAEAGAKVIITGRRAAALEEAAGDHPDFAAVVADAASAEDAARTVARAIDAYRRLDVLVNNASAGALLPLAEATAEKIQSIFAVNVVGPILLAAAALPYLADSKVAIVNVSSTYGQKPASGLSHYAASKAALEHLTRCWALELAPRTCTISSSMAFRRGSCIRRSQQVERLTSQQSAQLWRLATFGVQATKLFGGLEPAEHWLLTPALALARRRPLDLIESPASNQLATDLLTQLEYGVYI